MTVTIDTFYKDGVPRGELYQSSRVSIDTTSSSSFVVSPQTNPNYAILVNEIRFYDASFTTGGTGNGLLAVTYPSKSGLTTREILVEDAEYFGFMGKQITVNSKNYYVFEPQPPILLKAGSTNTSLSVGLPTNVTVASGSMSIAARGWKLEEGDYE